MISPSNLMLGQFYPESPPLPGRGRLSALVKELARRGFVLDESTIATPYREFSLSKSWHELKGRVMEDLKRKAWEELARQTSQPCIGDCSVWTQRAHARLLRKMNKYRQVTLMRCWSGCALTLSHRSTLDPSVSPICGCGCGIQDLHHLAFWCPLSPPPSPSLSSLSSLPRVLSRALPSPLLPLFCVCRQVESAVCSGGFQILTTIQDRHEPPPSLPLDTRGHCIVDADESAYSYCAYCHVTRCKRDRNSICAKKCKGRWTSPTCIGDYVVEQGHCLRLSLTPWKRDALRPRFTCCFCGTSRWATAEIRDSCACSAL